VDLIGVVAALVLEAVIVLGIWRVVRWLMRSGRVHIAGDWPAWLVGGQPDVDPALTRPARKLPRRGRERPDR
jgi:hypothetical protein